MSSVWGVLKIARFPKHMTKCVARLPHLSAKKTSANNQHMVLLKKYILEKNTQDALEIRHFSFTFEGPFGL